MLLSLNFLTDVGSVNNFDYAENIAFNEGDTVTVYFQLTDASVNKAIEGFKPTGRRYVPEVAATLQVTFGNIDDDKKVTRFAYQPFDEDDRSIWAVDILATDPVQAGTVSISFTLTQSSIAAYGKACSPIRVY